MYVVQYYSRPGCHLCEVMLEELLPLIRGRANIEICDIDSRQEWREKYGTRIPVIEYADQLVSGYPLDYGAVRRFLARLPENLE
ncbi:MAG: glutaredoxin family protein [Gammaproteobacteria bacterium]|nr:glutaredoxin family protein [Gammaproteobacteria bacterium]MDH5239459.1 glutaredoxin family protein [Gammaproteobacteria bacterium]MDH5260404.1 glutaredoxin family protein [Gammaproteobacteria bacterium]MDH5583154.1 glutaredoxin family protein [Gammaproteobacteria bacterium]